MEIILKGTQKLIKKLMRFRNIYSNKQTKAEQFYMKNVFTLHLTA
jgi:hypothetical protein